MKWLKKHSILISIILFILAFNVFFYYVSPEKIIEYIGIKNSYLVVFLFAAIGGLSSISGIIFFTTLANFAAGGSDPILLGLTGGIGVFISDSIFFLLAQFGRQNIPSKWESKVKKVKDVAERISTKKVLALSYLYLGFTLLPNDVLMLGLVLAGYRYKVIAPVLVLGGITVTLLAAHLGNIWL